MKIIFSKSCKLQGEEITLQADYGPQVMTRYEVRKLHGTVGINLNYISNKIDREDKKL